MLLGSPLYRVWSENTLDIQAITVSVTATFAFCPLPGGELAEAGRGLSCGVKSSVLFHRL